MNDTLIENDLIIAPDELPWFDLMAGIRVKILNLNEETGTWSVFMHLERGSSLPARQNNHVCEIYIIEGNGKYLEGETFKAGDYIHEDAGSQCSQIRAIEETTLFMVGHGASRFVNPDGTTSFTMDYVYFKKLNSDEVR